MNKEYVEWLDNLKKHWINKDIKKILNLFSKYVEYYETPFQKVDNIENVWNDIKDHELYKLTYRIMGAKENRVIVNFVMNDNDRIVNMVYEIEFNKENKCIKFKQWFMIK